MRQDAERLAAIRETHRQRPYPARGTAHVVVVKYGHHPRFFL